MFSDPDMAKDSVYDLHQLCMHFPANLQIMWASVNNTSDKCWGWTLIFSSEETKKLRVLRKLAEPG
jgi:hypothetical protein